MNIYYVYSDELYHHGVKGMRWGVLKSRTAVLYDKNPGHKAESKNSSSSNHYEGNSARAYKLSKKNGSDSTRAKIQRSKDNNSLSAKVNKFLENQARKNVSRSLKFQKKHKIGAYGRVSAAYYKRMGHTYRDPKTGKIVKPNQ